MSNRINKLAEMLDSVKVKVKADLKFEPNIKELNVRRKDFNDKVDENEKNSFAFVNQFCKDFNDIEDQGDDLQMPMADAGQWENSNKNESLNTLMSSDSQRRQGGKFVNNQSTKSAKQQSNMRFKDEFYDNDEQCSDEMSLDARVLDLEQKISNVKTQTTEIEIEDKTTNSIDVNMDIDSVKACSQGNLNMAFKKHAKKNAKKRTITE